MDNFIPNNSEGEISIEDKAIFSEFIDKLVNVQTEECTFQGILRSIDGYLNSVLENVEVISEVEPKNSLKLKTCFLRGVTIRHLNIIKSF